MELFLKTGFIAEHIDIDIILIPISFFYSEFIFFMIFISLLVNFIFFSFYYLVIKNRKKNIKTKDLFNEIIKQINRRNAYFKCKMIFLLQKKLPFSKFKISLFFIKLELNFFKKKAVS